MKKVTFGTPEEFVPSMFCRDFRPVETGVRYDEGRIGFRVNARGCVLTLPLEAEEQIYGFGLQITCFNHKNKKLTLRPNADPVKPTGDAHAPAPFFVSTGGYGIFFDTLRDAEFYCGVPDAATWIPGKQGEETYIPKVIGGDSVMKVQIPAAKGVTLYIFEGNTITDVVSEYNRMAGGGPLVPDWGLGPFYRCYMRYTQEEVLGMAEYFRKAEIPCDILGLEPGWQTRAYSCSYVWNPERFPDPEGMIRKLREMGYHVNLWEHAFTHPESPLAEEVKKGCGETVCWGGYVPDFALPEIRSAFAKYHREHVMYGAVDGFKLDECDGSDYTGSWSVPNCDRFPSGLDGEQYHSLFGTLYMQAMLEALEGQETLSEVRSAGALGASYPFVLYSDLYAHRDFIRACANSGFAGLLWAPELRHAESRKDLIRRLQTAVFSVQCLINAWYCQKAPWLDLGCEGEVRELLKLRKSLVPMLHKAFQQYHETGKAPVRALVSDFTNDPETWNIDDEYIFCDMIVAPLTAESDTRRVYLPEGEWVDFFTGTPASSGWSEYTGDGIPVYRRA